MSRVDAPSEDVLAEDCFPSHGDSRYFSLDGYVAIIERALALHYTVVPFRDFDEPGGGGAGGRQVADRPVMLLRHDLDHAIAGVERMADAEADLGVRATYFIQTTCEFYNLLSRSGRALVARLAGLGHEIGLHYESGRYAGSRGGDNVQADIRLLEDLSGQRIVSAAQHLPSADDPVDVLRWLRNEAYEKRFTAAPMTYLSDSLMVWRQVTPHDLLDQRRSFQFLTHPETWLGSFDNMFEALMQMKAGEVSDVERRYDEVARYYAHHLRDRAARDAQFIQKRSSAV